MPSSTAVPTPAQSSSTAPAASTTAPVAAITTAAQHLPPFSLPVAAGAGALTGRVAKFARRSSSAPPPSRIALGDLPYELLQLVAIQTAHCSATALSRLTLVSKTWHSAVVQVVVTEEGARSLAHGNTADIFAWNRSLGRRPKTYPTGPFDLLGAITTLSTSPARVVDFVQALDAAFGAVAELAWCSTFMTARSSEEDSEALGRALAKCAPGWWTPEQVVAVYVLPSQQRNFLKPEGDGYDQQLIALDILDLRSLIVGMASEQPEFSVTFEDALALLLKPEMTPQTEARAHVLFECFCGEQDEGYLDEHIAVSMATFAARCSLDIEAWMSAVNWIAIDEDLVDEDTSVPLACAALEAWADAADFPAAFSYADHAAMAKCLGSFDVDAQEALFEEVVIGWIRHMRKCHQHRSWEVFMTSMQLNNVDVW